MKRKKQFIKELVDNNTSLKAMYEEHIEAYDSVLPHVFFGELERIIALNFKSNDLAVRKIFKFLNQGLNSESESVRSLILASHLKDVYPEYFD